MRTPFQRKEAGSLINRTVIKSPTPFQASPHRRPFSAWPLVRCECAIDSHESPSFSEASAWSTLLQGDLLNEQAKCPLFEDDLMGKLLRRAKLLALFILLVPGLNADDKWKDYNKPLTVDELEYTDWQETVPDVMERTILMKAHTPTTNYGATCGETIAHKKRAFSCPAIEVDQTYLVNTHPDAICFIPPDNWENQQNGIWACFSITKASRRTAR